MMWSWIFIGLTFISELNGYSDGNFPQVCESMRPHHGRNGEESLPQTSEPPFMVSYQLGSNVGDPITVSLESKNDVRFRGFMLEARNLSLNGEGPPLGKFIILDSGSSRLLKCGNSQDSAVSNTLNLAKSLVKVNWTADGEEQDIIFRATFSGSFSRYWERVNVTVIVIRPTEPAPTQRPGETPTQRPSETPTQRPSETPTLRPGETPTQRPGETPTQRPGETPTQRPGETPTLRPGETGRNNETLDTRNETVNILLICVASPLAEMSMQIPLIIMAVHLTTSLYHDLHLTTSFCHDLCKKFRIVGSSLSVLFSLATFILSLIYNSEDIIIGLVSVVLAISFIEWIIAMLPLGPSHELNELVDCALCVCFVFHQVFINVFLYVSINSLFEEWGETTRVFWLLTVHTALTIVWNIVLCAKKRTLLQKKSMPVIDKAKHDQHHKGKKEHVSPKGVVVILCSVTLVVLSTSLSVLIFVDYF